VAEDRSSPLRGVSLVVTPLALGWAMQAWGRHRERAGHSTTSLATWYGGGALALGLAATRYVMIPDGDAAEQRARTERWPVARQPMARWAAVARRTQPEA
jgi:hypothetical protein